MDTTERRADLVVIGAGIAGLTAALTAAELGLDVVVLNKGPTWTPGDGEHPTSTFYAQGGIAVVDPRIPDDSIDLHLSDTVAAGAGLTDPATSEPILADGWPAVGQLVERGARFDTGADGHYLRTREGGHSVRRIIHAGGDATGARVQAALGAAAGEAPVDVVDDARATDVIVRDGRVVGAAYMRGTVRGVVWAPTVLLATGGVGHVYAATTNPAGATGDGIALALRAGARVADLEFIQFHPTMLYVAGARGRRTLVSEAVRGEGGRLVDADGRSVTDGVHPLGDLAPRDVVARAVTAAITRSGGDCVYLDISAVPDFERRFPTVTAGVRASGLDIDAGRLPVVPGAHYLCGGIATDVFGQTSVPGLLAAGESARTGLHGANRLASNSLLEGLVMGRRTADCAAARVDVRRVEGDVPALDSAPACDRITLQDTMSSRVALDRDAAGLRAADDVLAAGGIVDRADPRAAEDASLTLTARAVVAAALHREESRGCHQRSDFPEAAASATSQEFILDGERFVAV